MFQTEERTVGALRLDGPGFCRELRGRGGRDVASKGKRWEEENAGQILGFPRARVFMA